MKKEAANLLKNNDEIEFSWQGKILSGKITKVTKDDLKVTTPQGVFDVPKGRAEKLGTFEKGFAREKARNNPEIQ